MTQKITVLIVDDHMVVRAGLAGLLASQDDFEVVGECGDGAEGVKSAVNLTPDIILMDLRMPIMDGVTAIGKIKAQLPDMNILVLTTYDTDVDIVRAIEAGATGYLLKDTPRDELFRAIRATAKGESVLATAVAAKLLTQMRKPKEESLSPRELEVLSLVRQGLSNREIGKALHISTATVKIHLIHVFEKLNVTDRTSAVTVAFERGILSLNK